MKKQFMFFIVVLFIGFAGALVYEYYNSALASGTFEWTFYNSTGNFVQLNHSGNSYVEQGNYTSTIIDFGDVNTGYSQISWKSEGSCAENMSYIDKLGGYCIDQYEASKPDATSGSAGSDTSRATSKPGVLPWVSVSQSNSKTYCSNAGKHLCTSAEWLGAANVQGKVYNLQTDLASSPYYCNTGSSAAYPTGNSSGCVSAEGVYDMTGNVWELNTEVVDTIKPFSVGSNGYCYPQQNGSWGTSGSSYYGNDGVYFLANNNTGRAVLRGGGWADGADAGPFGMGLYYTPSNTNPAVGFRCCSEALD